MDGIISVYRSIILVLLIGFTFGDKFRLIILHNSDMHSRYDNEKGFGGFPRTAAYVNKLKKQAAQGKIPPVIFLNAGDTFTGTIWFSIIRWRIAADFVGALKPDCISLGNHEFDGGVESMVNYAKVSKVPIVCANCNFTNEPTVGDLVKPSYVLDINGTKVGVIGYLTPDTELASNPRNTKFEPEVIAIRREAQRLIGSGVNIIIAVGHSGYDMDREICRNVSEVDVVVGGHTNTFLWHGKPHTVPSKETYEGPYPTLIGRPGRPPCPVVAAYAYTKYIGHLALTFDEKGDLLESSGEDSYVVLLNDTFPEDPKLLKMLDEYRPQIETINNKIITYTDVSLNASRCRSEECNAANMVLDAFIDYKLNSYNGTDGWTDTAIAIINGGGIRESISAGVITQGHIFTMLPFFQKVLSFEIYGHQLRKTLEVGVRSDFLHANGEFIQVSGIHYTFDRLRPVDHRITSITVRCARCPFPQYKKLSHNELYRIITVEFLANGGDGHSTLKNRVNTIVEESFDTEIVLHYLENSNNIRPEVENRISFGFAQVRLNGNILRSTFMHVLFSIIIIPFHSFLI